MWVGLKQGVSNPARPGHALKTMTSRWPRRLLVALLFPALFVSEAACTSYSDYRFSPGVQDIEIRNPSESVLARVLIAPRGIHEHEHGEEEWHGGPRPPQVTLGSCKGKQQTETGKAGKGKA